MGWLCALSRAQRPLSRITGRGLSPFRPLFWRALVLGITEENALE